MKAGSRLGLLAIVGLVVIALLVLLAFVGPHLSQWDYTEKDYNAFLHFPVAGLYFLVISMAIFFIFGRIYRHLMRHLPQAPKIRFSPRLMR